MPLELPPLWNHQREAIEFARDKPGTMLAMDMGTGKSRTVIELLNIWDARSVLILCPKSVVPVWQKQFGLFARSQDWDVVTLNRGTIAQRCKQAEEAVKLAKARGHRVAVVINYESGWRAPFGGWAGSHTWDVAIADESHRVKAPGGKASMWMMRLRPQTRRRLCLTGTPMPHSPLDIYAQYRFLDPTIFGRSVLNFKARYAVAGGFEGRQITGWQNQDELTRLVYSIAYQVGREVLDLPPEMHIERECELGASARKLYDKLYAEFVAWVESADETVTVTNALTKLLRLQQIACGHVRTDRSDEHPKGEIVEVDTAKRELLADIIEDLPAREPIAVFGWFHPDLDNIKKVCEAQGRTYCELSGRRNELADWQAGKYDVIGVQIQSGGEGIDLTRTCYGVYYSVGFSLGRYKQSLSRINRPGQTRPVRYYHLTVANTVDADVYKALANKEEVIESILHTAARAGRRVEGAA